MLRQYKVKFTGQHSFFTISGVGVMEAVSIEQAANDAKAEFSKIGVPIEVQEVSALVKTESSIA